MLETPSARAALSVLTPKPSGQAPSPNGGSLVVDKNVLLGNAFSRDLFWVGVRSNKVNPFDWALGFCEQLNALDIGASLWLGP